MRHREFIPEQRSGYRKIYATLAVGVGMLAVEGFVLLEDLPVPAAVQGGLAIAGIGLTASSIAYIWENNQHFQETTPPDESA